MIEKQCLVCGNDFICRVLAHKKNRGKFCSRKCYNEFRKEKKAEVICENCGKKKLIKKWRITVRQNKHYFCCSECYHKFRSDNKSLYKSGAKEFYKEITKEILQKMYVEQEMKIKDIAEHFGCGYTLISVKLKKNGIKTRRQHEYIKTPTSLVAWYKKLYEKYHGCQICGWNEGRCDVHHLVSRLEDGKNEENNLVLICPNHHRLIHQNKLKI